MTLVSIIDGLVFLSGAPLLVFGLWATSKLNTRHSRRVFSYPEVPGE